MGPAERGCQAGLPGAWLPCSQHSCGLPPHLCLHPTLHPLLCDSRPGSGVVSLCRHPGDSRPSTGPTVGIWEVCRLTQVARARRRPGLPRPSGCGGPQAEVSCRPCHHLVVCRRTRSLTWVVSRQCLVRAGTGGPHRSPAVPQVLLCYLSQNSLSPESIAGIMSKSRLLG